MVEWVLYLTRILFITLGIIYMHWYADASVSVVKVVVNALANVVVEVAE